MTDAELKALAELASPGPWTHYSGKLRQQFPAPIHEIHDGNSDTIVRWPGFDGLDISSTQCTANADFMAACHPQTILALLAENERLLAALTEIVAVDDLKKRMARMPSKPGNEEYLICCDELAKRQPLAWSSARAALEP